MKRASLIFLFTSYVLTAFSSTKDIDSKISHVSVYPQGATVTRESSFSISKGLQNIRFYGISNTLDPNSIQLEATGDYIVQSISYRYDYLKPLVESPMIKGLQDSITNITDRKTKLQAIRYVYDQELQFIVANRTLPNQTNFSQSNEIKSIADLIRDRLMYLKLELHKLSLRERELNIQLGQTNAQINQIRGNSPKPQGIIEVQLMAEENISGKFVVRYFVRNASWRPVYDLKFTGLETGVETKYNAFVNQTTGVDWEGAKLTLSTSTPNQNNNKPVLHPWQLYYKAPNQIYNRKDAYRNGYDLESKQFEAEDDIAFNMAKNTPQFTEMMETVLAMDFEVDLAYNIPSDGKERVINLRKTILPAEYTYYAAPKVEKEAFLVANLTGWANKQLLPGAANIFMGNTYMGASYLNPGLSSDTLEVAFGRDKMVQIDRQLVNRECNKTWMVGKQKHSYTYEISIRNLHKTAIFLTLQDQVPITSIEDIEVNTTERSGAKQDDNGILTWKLEIGAGVTQKKKFGFDLKHPRNKQVQPL